jgi:hypothetical protein
MKKWKLKLELSAKEGRINNLRLKIDRMEAEIKHRRSEKEEFIITAARNNELIEVIAILWDIVLEKNMHREKLGGIFEEVRNLVEFKNEHEAQNMNQ